MKTNESSPNLAEKEFLARRNACIRAKHAAEKQDRCLCTFCGFTGQITAREGFATPEQKLRPGTDGRKWYSFRCPHCNAAEQMGIGESYPVWKAEFNKTFDMLEANKAR